MRIARTEVSLGLELLFYFLIFLSFAGLTYALMPAAADPAVIRRVREIRVRRKNPYAVEEAEMARPFSERVVLPAFRNLVKSLLALTPESFRRRLAERLSRAGAPVALGTFWAAKLILGLLAFVIFGMLLPSATTVDRSKTLLLLLSPVAAILGYGLPEFWLSSLVSARRQAIERALPDVMDLLCISVEAGLGFDGAMQKVGEKFRDPISAEFGQYLREIRLGKPRGEALRDLARRTAVPDFQAVAASIIQADELGVSLGRVLRVQSTQMRQRRRQRAEEQAMKTPIKMLFPLVLFIFPTVFMILLGPVAVHYILIFRQ